MATITDAADPAALQYVLDRLAIQDLIVQYALGQDLHENGDDQVHEQWDVVFAPDARLDYRAGGAAPDLDYQTLIHTMRGPGGTMSGLGSWQHLQGFAAVDIDGDTATARTQHLHTHTGTTDGKDWNLIQTGFFMDRLERRSEGWRITHRTLEILWMQTFPTL
ncbi:nuclear transport factor 2 family protein [Nocardioides sp. NPDC087217]|uniref:nuclear transport factor 2 family protein n=1 Tax=Nocardioides sp. NPDC087217 TaxID=3364335 RepID=UPI00382E1925